MAVRAADPLSPAPPPFTEVYNIIRSNLAGADEKELDRAATLGLLAQLQSRVTLLTNAANAAASSALPFITSSNVFENAYGFVRIGRVGPGLATRFSEQIQQMRAGNPLRGLIIDLRYADGHDYAAAAETADLFFAASQPLLTYGGHTARSTAKDSALDLPVVVLINEETAGAAEALAAVLRQLNGSLIIGSASAGHAYLFQDFPLSNGQTLRVASAAVSVGTGQTLPNSGVAPDIRIAVSPEDEKLYFEDPYRVLPRLFAQAAKPGPNDLASGQSTNRPRRRLNEAELVRMQREGIDFTADASATGKEQLTSPVIADPALARGLDLLKGLALAFKRQ
jgi:hypothetical protein